MAQVCELEMMLKGLPEDRQKAIREKADRLEVYFNTQGVVMMKDKDEQWCEGMLQDGESMSDFTKLPKGDG